MSERVSNHSCRASVQSRRPFKASNLYAEQVRGAYVVYSYGPHWPLFAYINGQWYENADRRSVSTARHRTQSHPQTSTVEVDGDKLNALILAS